MIAQTKDDIAPPALYDTGYHLCSNDAESRKDVQGALLLTCTYLYLKVLGLVSNALSAHVSPVFVQPALECVDRW